MLLVTNVLKTKQLNYFFSTINQAFLNKKLFFLSWHFKSFLWALLLLNLGVISSWERCEIMKKKNKIRFKFFLRYKNLIPTGFFWTYKLSLKKSFFVTCKTLRTFFLFRPGIKLLLSTVKGLLTINECLSLNLGGSIVGFLV